MRNKLKQRLRTLWTLELANAVIVFPLFYVVLSASYRLGWFSPLALLAVCAILTIGAIFWFLKLRALSGTNALAHPRTRRFFHATKIVFRAALSVLVVVFAVYVISQPDISHAELLISSGLLILAWLEYINYYVVQLMIDNRADLDYLRTHRRLKRAIMAREFDF